MKVTIDISEEELKALSKTEDLLDDYAWNKGWDFYSTLFEEIEPCVKIINKIYEAANNMENL
jgi:hypothetical protein